jgi:hypothetical protein
MCGVWCLDLAVIRVCKEALEVISVLYKKVILF